MIVCNNTYDTKTRIEDIPIGGCFGHEGDVYMRVVTDKNKALTVVELGKGLVHYWGCKGILVDYYPDAKVTTHIRRDD